MGILNHGAGAEVRGDGEGGPSRLWETLRDPLREQAENF